MEQAAVFLMPSNSQSDSLCVICDEVITTKQKFQKIGDVHKRVTQDGRDKSKDIRVHTNCRVQFRNYRARYLQKFGLKNVNTCDEVTSSEDKPSPKKQITRSETDFQTAKVICFICNSKRNVDSSPYNEGGLARCSTDVTAQKLFQRKDIYLENKSHKQFAPARRLHLMLSGHSHDLFAVDIFYHQSCYIRFALKPATREEESDAKIKKESEVMNAFIYNLKTAVIRDKKAFLPDELLADIEILSGEQNLSVPLIKETKSLRRAIEKKIGEEIGFFPSGKFWIVHSTDINPCEYSVATLLGRGLRDEDHIKAFGRMLRRKFAVNMQKRSQYPQTREDFMEMLNDGPHPDLYNALYYSMYEHGTLNEYGQTAFVTLFRSFVRRKCIGCPNI
eukprot:gene16356-18001_t